MSCVAWLVCVLELGLGGAAWGGAFATTASAESPGVAAALRYVAPAPSGGMDVTIADYAALRRSLRARMPVDASNTQLTRFYRQVERRAPFATGFSDLL